MAKRKQSDSASKKPEKKAKHTNSFASTWSKSKKKRMRQRKARQKRGDMGGERIKKSDRSSTNGTVEVNKVVVVEQEEPSSNNKSSALQEAFKARLAGSRFRELNEVRTRVSSLFTLSYITLFRLAHVLPPRLIIRRNSIRQHRATHLNAFPRILNCMSNITMAFVIK